MANNYTYFSFQVLLKSDEEREWLKTFLKYAENSSCDTVRVEDGPQSEELLEVFPDWNELEILGLDWEVDGEIDGLWLYSGDGEAIAERAADLVEFFLRKFGRNAVIGFEYCCKSGANRLGEFYGGACVITASGQDWHESRGWMDAKVKGLNKG